MGQTLYGTDFIWDSLCILNFNYKLDLFNWSIWFYVYMSSNDFWDPFLAGGGAAFGLGITDASVLRDNLVNNYLILVLVI